MCADRETASGANKLRFCGEMAEAWVTEQAMNCAEAGTRRPLGRQRRQNSLGWRGLFAHGISQVVPLLVTEGPKRLLSNDQGIKNRDDFLPGALEYHYFTVCWE